MIRYLTLALAAAAIALPASAARATDSEACCACVRSFTASEGSAAAAPSTPAFFCGEFPSTEAAGERCEEFDARLLCFKELAQQPPVATCEEMLAEQNITCPVPTGAPVGHAGGLAALAAALVAAGSGALRRRRA